MSETPPEEYTSPFPTCRVTATADPFAAVRLDVRRERAAHIAKRIHDTLTAHSGDGLLDIPFLMDRRAYTTMAENLGQLLETEAEAIQVVVDPDPAYSIMVILNRSQIQKLEQTAKRAIQIPGNTFAWEVSVSEDGADMLLEQLKAAVKGEDDPLSVVKTDD